jgi:dihydrodipicolinate synthase/N-acetylneuraminate lyase
MTGASVAQKSWGGAPLVDPLWVPPISHYAAAGTVDPQRWRSLLVSLRPTVRQFLIGGSTGDGWELDDQGFADLVRATLSPGLFGPDTKLLFGILRPTAEEIVARAGALKALLTERSENAPEIVGIAVCPPVLKDADQDTIRAHYRRVLDGTDLPVAIYQLPQVTGCTLAPDALAELTRDPRIVMFKDTSGADEAAFAGATAGITALRGAEGRYAEMLRPRGPYDGWLLSTGNAFSVPLRTIAGSLARDEVAAAQAASDRMSEVVSALFAAAAPLPFGNAFSNANRAADHVMAWGDGWITAPPPITISGRALPHSLIAEAASGLAALGCLPTHGYLRR